MCRCMRVAVVLTSTKIVLPLTSSIIFTLGKLKLAYPWHIHNVVTINASHLCVFSRSMFTIPGDKSDETAQQEVLPGCKQEIVEHAGMGFAQGSADTQKHRKPRLNLIKARGFMTVCSKYVVFKIL